MTAYIILIILALGLVAFFSGSETALISSNLMRLRYLVEKKRRQATVAYNLLKRPDLFLATVLVGTNLAVVTSSAIATFLFVRLTPEKGALLATCVMSPLVLIFGELIPKTISRIRANNLVLKIAPPLLLFQKILYPVVRGVNLLASWNVRLINPKGIKKNPFITKEEIKLLIKQIAQEGVLEEGEKEAIHSIFDFAITKVGDVMVNLKDIISVDYAESAQSIMEKSKIFGFTRFPIFQDKALKGVINIFELFYNQGDWRNFIRPLRQVDINQRLDRVFAQMQPNKESMAAVIKDNKVVGIITMEDLMEEVVCRIY